jgi:hypothetical protein
VVVLSVVVIIIQVGLYIQLNVHAPSEEKRDDVKDSFYEELERVFDQFAKFYWVISMRK